MPETYDWWSVAVDGGEPVAMRAADRLKAAGITGISTFGPASWQDGRILFSDHRALWEIPVDGTGALEDAPRRLTFGTSLDSDPSAGPGGLIAFTSAITEGAIWTLPLEVEAGTAAGSSQRLTEGAGP